MNIVIAGGQTKADFLVGMFLKQKHRVIVINDTAEYAEYLAHKHDINVIVNDPSKYYVLEAAGIENFDVLVALLPDDSANLAVCQMAKSVFHVHKTVSAVSDPKNVEIFQKLGVDTVISATFLISKYIEQASTLESLARSIVTEYDQLSLTTVNIVNDSQVVNKTLQELQLPEGISIGCIMRGNTPIIPKGSTRINAQDKVLLITQASLQQVGIDLLK